MKEEQTKHDKNYLSINLPAAILVILLIICFFALLICGAYDTCHSFYVRRVNVKDGVAEEIALYDTFHASVENPQDFNENSEQADYMINFNYDMKGKVSLVTWDDVSNNWSDCELFEINDKEYKFNLLNELNEEENVNYKVTVDNKEFYFTIVNSSKTD